MLLRKLLSCLVVVAYHIYHKDMASQRNLLASCFSKLMTNNILPNAKNVKGFVFRQPEHTEIALQYLRKSWEVYQAYSTPNAAPRDDRTMTCRDLLLMLKDFHLLDNKLTTTKFMEIVTTESLDSSYLSTYLLLEIVFLEFFEMLLGCAEVKCKLDCDDADEVTVSAKSRPESDAAETSEQTPEAKATSPAIATPVNSITFQVSCSESEVAVPRVTPGLSSAQHIDNMVQSLPVAEDSEEGRGSLTPKQNEPEKKQLELWMQKISYFFDQVFFVAFEQHQSVMKLIKENNLTLKAHECCVALARSKQKAL